MAISMRAWFALALLLSALVLSGCTQSQPAPGSDRDAHGCIPSAGYSWCESNQKCLRVWEENCTTPAAPKPVVAAPAPPKPCLGLSSVPAHDACWADQAKQQKTAALCDRVYQLKDRDSCLLGFVSNDATRCEQLSSIPSQDSCYNTVAHALNQSALCAKLRDANLQRSCNIDLSSPCAVETTPEAVARCEAMRQRNPMLCMDDDCRFGYAQTTRTLDACDQIRSDRARTLACKATAMLDSTYCASDNISSRADLCYELSAQALNDSSWCSYGQLGSPYRDDCYNYFAVQARNPDTCKFVYLETGRDNCYLNYSVSIDAPAVCAQVINSLNRNKCYMHTALQRGDPAACNGLLGKDRTSCYNLVVTGPVPIRDSAACMAIENVELWRPRCLTALAIQKKDSSFCELIDPGGYQSDCKVKLS
jgi:hypothetical protein